MAHYGAPAKTTRWNSQLKQTFHLGPYRTLSLGMSLRSSRASVGKPC